MKSVLTSHKVSSFMTLLEMRTNTLSTATVSRSWSMKATRKTFWTMRKSRKSTIQKLNNFWRMRKHLSIRLASSWYWPSYLPAQGQLVFWSSTTQSVVHQLIAAMKLLFPVVQERGFTLINPTQPRRIVSGTTYQMKLRNFSRNVSRSSMWVPITVSAYTKHLYFAGLASH